jgi:hypothetical protein
LRQLWQLKQVKQTRQLRKIYQKIEKFIEFFLNNGHCYEFFYKRCLKGDDQYDRYSNERGLNTICLNERNSTKLDTVTFEQKMFICKIVTCKKFD